VRCLEAVIFDWAGTAVDFGSLAPVRALTKLFANRDIHISDADARREMGLYKKDHIRRLLSYTDVAAHWRRQYGRAANEDDVETMFVDFAAMQMEILEDYSQLIEGIASLATRLRGRGLKLGSTTGYTRPMLDVLAARASEQGYRNDLALCPDDVSGGRPHPWMCLRIALDFRLSSTAAAVKVGDTPIDVSEGRNAGMWTVGVTATGNEVGLSPLQLAALQPDERRRCLDRAHNNLMAAGAHYVIESAAGLEPILEQIDRRLAAGERP
jgi:phosphonoacetaldehyde hydrolase